MPSILTNRCSARREILRRVTHGRSNRPRYRRYSRPSWQFLVRQVDRRPFRYAQRGGPGYRGDDIGFRVARTQQSNGDLLAIVRRVAAERRLKPSVREPAACRSNLPRSNILQQERGEMSTSPCKNP